MNTINWLAHVKFASESQHAVATGQIALQHHYAPDALRLVFGQHCAVRRGLRDVREIWRGYVVFGCNFQNPIRVPDQAELPVPKDRHLILARFGERLE